MIYSDFQNDVHFILESISLNSITCSGSMGIISARYLEHPFETVANIEKVLRQKYQVLRFLGINFWS